MPRERASRTASWAIAAKYAGGGRTGKNFQLRQWSRAKKIDGRTILTVVHRDISERKELEDLREAAARELDHRLRNLLAVVNSLVSLSASSATDVEEFKNSLTGRLNALARTQSALLGKQQSASLRGLFQAELGQYQTGNGANVAIVALPIAVGSRAAQMLALVIHELATNAAKYGALSSAGGHVAVTAVFEDDVAQERLIIKWQEAGGPIVKPPKRQSFGTRLIKEVVAKALRAQVDIEYRAEGLVCQITVPKAMLEAAS